MYLNHTESFSFSIYLNDVLLDPPLFAITVVTPKPSDLSQIRFLSSEESIVTDRWIDVVTVPWVET